MRRPSDNLIHRLTTLGLATERDLVACEPTVKRLCQNLPEFDSVWIDALVQRRILTPWQADMLASPKAESLRVGEYCKTRQIGPQTFHAVSVETGREVVLQPVSSESQATRLKRQMQSLKTSASAAPVSLEFPRQFLAEGESKALPEESGHYVASRFVAGWTAQDLIIRGGRIPWPAVAEIGRQALDALRWLEEQDVVHGDISLDNLRLRPNGEAVLVSSLTGAEGGISLTANLRLKDVATRAPECIGSGLAAGSSSELYSLGCVLWQLLTARPPFLSADPVTKVLKSQEADVEDVRRLVPDCPDWMARQLQSLTRRSPELRTASCAEAYQQWQQNTHVGVSQTRRLLKRLPDRSLTLIADRNGASPFGSRVASVVTAAVMVSAFAFLGFQRGLIPVPLNLTGPRLTDGLTLSKPVVTDSVPVESSTADQSRGHLALPEPDAAGVVVLESGQTYVAADLEYAGVMHIETTGAGAAIVERTSDQAWRISSDQIVMRNIEVRSLPSVQRLERTLAAQTAVHCSCDVLSVDRCRFDSGEGGNRDRGIYWSTRAGLASVVSIRNSVFRGRGYGLWSSVVPKRCELNNLLVRTSRAALRFDVTGGGRAIVELEATGITQTGGISFLDAVVLDPSLQELHVRLTCGESVLSVTTGLVQIAGPDAWPLERAKVECLLPERGNPTIVPPGVRTAIGFDAGLNSVVALHDSQVTAEALLIANPVFRGDEGRSRDQAADLAFELLDYEGPKLSQKLPGVDLQQLPLTE